MRNNDTRWCILKSEKLLPKLLNLYLEKIHHNKNTQYAGNL